MSFHSNTASPEDCNNLPSSPNEEQDGVLNGEHGTDWDMPDVDKIGKSTGYWIRPVVPGEGPVPRSWLIEGILLNNSVSFIAAQPKVGKTWLALEAALAVSLAEPFLGRAVECWGRVLYFAGEDAEADVLARVDRLLRGRGLDRNALGGRLSIVPRAVSLDDPEERDKLMELFLLLDPTLIVFDPLARFLGGVDEDSATKMRPVVNWLRHDVSRLVYASVLVVHHTDKRNRGMRGSGDLRAVGETIITMGEGKTAESIRLAFDTRGVRPDPFEARLVDLPSGGICWIPAGAGVNDDREAQGRRLLEEAGREGLGVTTAREKLGVQAAKVPKILASAGGVQVGKRGKWYLPHFLPSSRSAPSGMPGNFPRPEIPGAGTNADVEGRQGATRDKAHTGAKLQGTGDPKQAPTAPVSTFPSAPTPQGGACGEGGTSGENGNINAGGAL